MNGFQGTWIINVKGVSMQYGIVTRFSNEEKKLVFFECMCDRVAMTIFFILRAVWLRALFSCLNSAFHDKSRLDSEHISLLMQVWWSWLWTEVTNVSGFNPGLAITFSFWYSRYDIVLLMYDSDSKYFMLYLEASKSLKVKYY